METECIIFTIVWNNNLEDTQKDPIQECYGTYLGGIKVNRKLILKNYIVSYIKMKAFLEFILNLIVFKITT